MEAEAEARPLLKGHGTRNADSLQEWKQQDGFSLQHPQKEHSPAHPPVSACRTRIQTSILQNYNITHLCCLGHYVCGNLL